MTSPRTLSAIASAAAASFTVAGAHAATLYDAGLLSFESKAQSMWGSGDAFRKAESVFVGTEWSEQARPASAASRAVANDARLLGGTARADSRRGHSMQLWVCLELLAVRTGMPSSSTYTIDNPMSLSDTRLPASAHKVDVTLVRQGRPQFRLRHRQRLGRHDGPASAPRRSCRASSSPPSSSAFRRAACSTGARSPPSRRRSRRTSARCVKLSGSIGREGVRQLERLRCTGKQRRAADDQRREPAPAVDRPQQPEDPRLACCPAASRWPQCRSLNQTLALEGGVSPTKPPVVGYAADRGRGRDDRQQPAAGADGDGESGSR